MNPAFVADIDLKEFIVGSIGINNWVFFGLSVLAVLLFSMFHGSNRPNSNLIPNLNLLISTALVLKWYSFLSIDPRYNQSATFGEMALNLPLVYLQTLLMSQESLPCWFLLTIFNGLYTISIWAFTISFSGFEWLWLVFAIIFYFGILSVLGDTVLCVMKRKSGTVISIYNLFLIGYYLINFALYKTSKYSLFVFYLLMGIMDILSRIGLGFIYCYYSNQFEPINLFPSPILQQIRTEVPTNVSVPAIETEASTNVPVPPIQTETSTNVSVPPTEV